jgi:hypothetical protein
MFEVVRGAQILISYSSAPNSYNDLHRALHLLNALVARGHGQIVNKMALSPTSALDTDEATESPTHRSPSLHLSLASPHPDPYASLRVSDFQSLLLKSAPGRHADKQLKNRLLQLKRDQKVQYRGKIPVY